MMGCCSQYITDEIGGISFDDKEEISRATSVAFKRLDSDRDGLIEPADLRHFWQTKNHGLRTVDEVCDWVEHAVQLPQYAGAFRKNAIVGSDFPWLLEQEGAMLRDDVGIVSELHRRQILRGIRMVVLSVGSVVNAPQGLLAESHADGLVLLQWATSLEDGIPAHRYELQRRLSDQVVCSRASFHVERHIAAEHAGHVPLTARPSWRTIFVGTALSYADTVRKGTGSQEYRVRAWNLVGHSEWSNVSCVIAILASIPTPLLPEGTKPADASECTLYDVLWFADFSSLISFDPEQVSIKISIPTRMEASDATKSER